MRYPPLYDLSALEQQQGIYTPPDCTNKRTRHAYTQSLSYGCCLVGLFVVTRFHCRSAERDRFNSLQRKLYRLAPGILRHRLPCR